MGNETSLPSKVGEFPNDGTASPQAATASPSQQSSSISETPTASSSQPQARKKPPGISNAPNNTSTPVNNTAAPSMMSRAGLTSMIQRMGVTSTQISTSKQKSKKSNTQRGAVGEHASSAETVQTGNHNTNSTNTNVVNSAMGGLVGKITDLVIGDSSQPHPTQNNSQSTTPMNMQQPKSQPSDEDDWEKAWAEDSESDEEDDHQQQQLAGKQISDDTEATAQPPTDVQTTQHLRLDAISPVGHTVSSNFRPDLDSGHSSMGVGIDLGGDLGLDKVHPPQQQQEKEADKGISLDESTSQPLQQESQEEGDQAMREDWEGYDHEIQMAIENEAERPCVDMFDPALRVLGRGSFGRVVLVQKRYGQSQGSLYAMKILRKSHLVRRRQIERTKTERKVLSVLNHPFIMRLYYAFQTSEKLYLVLDYCPGGELFFHLSRYRRFQEPVARFYAAELLLAIGHLHKHGIIYRDLKPENVLLDAYGHVKLGDFGLAKDGIRHPTQGAKSTCGTPEYMAPEVLNQTGHGFCVDYWGLGMILYEMMTGLPPWYTTDRSKLFRRLRSAPLIFPNEVQFSPHCKACIAGLLERDPRLRLGVLGLRSAMRHEFFYRRINFEALRACQIAAPIRPCEGWRQFANKNSTVKADGADTMSISYRGHSAGPSFESAAMGQITMELLDVATENFDETFRRMPIETEDYEKHQQAAGQAPITEQALNEQTFRGFTFDGDELMDDAPQHSQQQQQQQQQLYHHQRQQGSHIRQPQQQQTHQQQQSNNRNDGGEMM